MMRALSILLCAVLPLAGQTKRALIVGIDHYQTHPATTALTSPTQAVVEKASGRQNGTVARPPVQGRSRDTHKDLEGAVADATNYRQILIDRYGFAPENIIFLTDKKNAKTPADVATAQRILDTFQSHLIAAAKPGDISVFVYAGHGSRMRNEGSDEQDKMDQTLVPADSEDGVPDIRDKELARLYRKAADKKVLLTIIADSCHSGGISRGAGSPPLARDEATDLHIVNDPPDINPKTGKPFPDPAESGYVLVISSAKDNEAAMEMDANGQQRGVFSYYFQENLKEQPADEPIDQIFSRTVALMRANGQMQVPNLEGAGRRKTTLLGTAASATAGVSAAVQDVSKGQDGTKVKVTLRGGLSLGLQKGCELLRNGDKNGTRIRITEPPTLASAVAEVVSGDPPKAGDLFVLDRWTVPQDVATRFYLPSAGLPTLAELRATAAAMHSATANWHWISDPTKETPDVVLRFAGGSWEIERRSDSKVTRSSLGKSPTAAEWTAALANLGKQDKQGIFVDFPPPAEFVASLRSKIDPGTDAVVYVENRPEALYHLVGRLLTEESGLDFEYAWILPNSDGRDEGNTPLPVRTDWFAVSDLDAAAQLEQRALNLTRLRLWLQVSVPGGGAHPFPYTLALENLKTGELKTDGTLVEDEVYDLVLTSTSDKLKEATESDMPQWVYVATIDQTGRMRTIFPRQSSNGSWNYLPRDSAPTEIVLRDKIPVGEPYGTDTLILLTSQEEVDPAALQIDPVLTRGSRGSGPQGSVTALLFRMQGASRGFDDPAPTDWGVQRLTFRSVEKSKANQ